MFSIRLHSNDSLKKVSIQRLEQLFGIHYLHTLTFQDWNVERWILNKCSKAHQKGHIDSHRVWLGSLHGKMIESATPPPISIEWINEHVGYGVFAQKAFTPWEFVGEYAGVLRRRSLLLPNINDYCFMYPKAWISLKAFTIDSEKEGNFTRFINHSDTPNLESISIFHKGVLKVALRANRKIEMNEELTYDYGDIYWVKRKKLNYTQTT